MVLCQCDTDSQWSKQKSWFSRATHGWVAANHNTSVISGEWIFDVWSGLYGQLSVAAVSQSYVFHEAIKCYKNMKIH